MEKIRFNYSKLRGRIKEKCDSQKVFAERLGVSEATLTSKLQGNTYFTQSEIWKSTEILGIQPDEVALYFFAA